MTLPLEPRDPDGEALAANCIVFGRLLRRAGLAVDPDQTRTFTRALGLLGVARKGDVRAAGRAIYVQIGRAHV